MKLRQPLNKNNGAMNFTDRKIFKKQITRWTARKHWMFWNLDFFGAGYSLYMYYTVLT